MSRSFFTYFPPPPFLAMNALGVSVNDDYIRVIEFKLGSKGRTLGKFQEKKVPQGIIEDGEIKKPSEFILLLKEIKKEFGYQFVRVSLPEEKAYVFKTELPHIAPEAIASAVEFKIQENVPISPGEAVFDYSVISEDKDSIQLSVTVVPTLVVESYTETFRKAGFTPISFKVESQAVARAIIHNGDFANALVINFNENQTGFYIVSGGIVQFASTLKLGSDSLTSLIERHFKVSLAEAEKIKKQKAFSKNHANTELMFSISNSLSVIRDEANKVLAYWKTYTRKGDNDEGQKIEKIILCGEDVIVAGIDRYMSLNIGLPIEIARVWDNAFNIREHIPALSMEESLNYAAAIGLALGPRSNTYV
jgi:type IV pilus assembly protein PilM